MESKSQIRILLAAMLSVSIIFSAGTFHFVKARELTDLNALASNQTIDNDLFIALQQVTIDSNVNGDVFVLGNQVVVNGDIDGSLFAIGQRVEIEGQVSGTTYAAAISLKLGQDASLQRSLYYIGGVFSSEAGTKIQRDLNTICLDAKINGQIGRNTNAMIGILNLLQLIIQSLSGVIDFPEWMLQPIGCVPNLAAGGSINAILLAYLLQGPVLTGEIDTARLAEWGINLLRQFGLLLVLGLIAFWLLHKPLSRSAQELRSKPFTSLGYGLVGLFIVLMVYLATILVAVLIFVTGLWIGFLGMWDFTLAFWLFSYSTLGLFLALLILLVAFGSKLIVSYLVGTWLFEKLAPKSRIHKAIALVVGILIYSLARSIPMLGWVIGVLVVAWGLGAAWLAYRSGGLCCCCKTSELSEKTPAILETAE